MPIRRVVEPGDSVISLAEQHGLFAGTIWDDPANADLRKLRSDMNVLMPGDVVVIPDLRPGKENRATGQMHRFRRKGVPAVFRMQLFDLQTPRANQKYTLTVDGIAQTGSTDAQGILEKYVPAQAQMGNLVIGDDEMMISLQFGYLDPLTEITGVQKRLTNLGYACGDADGTLNDNTRNALLAFQRATGLNRTGEIDQATKDKLLEIHDQPYTFPQGESGAA